MRQAADPWVWVPPSMPEPQYAVMRWMGGTLYAGPASSAADLPKPLMAGATMLLCTRAEALRMAMNGKIEA